MFTSVSPSLTKRQIVFRFIHFDSKQTRNPHNGGICENMKRWLSVLDWNNGLNDNGGSDKFLGLRWSGAIWGPFLHSGTHECRLVTSTM